MLSSFKRFLQLPSADRRIFLSFWFRLLQVRLELVFSERYKKQVSAGLGASVEVVGEAQIVELRRIMGLLNQAAYHHLVSMSCLVICLTGYRYLQLQQVPVQLRLGVQMVDKRLYAHAWLECDGVVITDEVETVSKFSVLGS
jgi:hypothetical protein